ncbi:hypothetical protein ET445_13665 [Agromyces protaetiae]|uniref:Uncharacterized protein n=1 Tax=Agromyces protaetiae TaxID=2509455 RepID=A0A4P6FEI5_9MICO|nr:hypothetical protein [Agromyces protaetiae]QAY74216.1 hypothetical protein ET445_13665 [Agromyces protaetiae]
MTISLLALAPAVGLLLTGAPLTDPTLPSPPPMASELVVSSVASDDLDDEPAAASSYRFLVINESSNFVRFDSVTTDRFEGRPVFGDVLAPGGRHYFEVQFIPFKTNDPTAWYTACGATADTCGPQKKDLGSTMRVGPAGPNASYCSEDASSPLSCLRFQYRYGDWGVEFHDK